MTEPANQTPPTSWGSRRAYLFLLAAVVVVAAAWAWRWVNPPLELAPGPLDEARIEPSFIRPDELDRLIAAYEERITLHTDALDYRTLGFLYLEKGRVSGDLSRYVAAQEAFAEAIDLAPGDSTNRVGLASAAYGLHDFEESLEIARAVQAAVPRPDAHALVADSHLALGHYTEARRSYDALANQFPDSPQVMVRLANLARLEGRGKEAWGLSGDALGTLDEVRNPRQLAWYQTFAAQMGFDLGHHDRALDLAAEAVANDPPSIEAAATHARLLAAKERYDQAIDEYLRATATVPNPTYLAELGDLYYLRDEPDLADEQYATVEVVADLSASRGVYDRTFALYLVDHGLQPERAVAIAEDELERRTDVAGWDAYAWALLSAGRAMEAREASDQALALGTLDARFLYHAGMISAALGEEDRARRQLQAALQLNPGFQPLQVERAEATLEEFS